MQSCYDKSRIFENFQYVVVRNKKKVYNGISTGFGMA